MRARRGDDLDDITFDRVRDVDLARRGLGAQELVRAHDLLDRLERMDDALRVEDRELLVLARVAELDAHEESVELGLGKREGPLVLDRVLRRHHQEGLGELVRRAVDGDLVLLHRLEEGGLGLRRGAVDLVREDDLAHHRTRPELERVRALVEDRHAGHVGGQQVRGELDPPERAAERAREGLREHRLPRPRHVLDEDVSAADERDQGELDLVVLPENDPLDVVDDAGDPRDEGLVHVLGTPLQFDSAPVSEVWELST